MPVRGHQIERRAIQAVASDGRLQVWQNVYGKVGGRVVRRYTFNNLLSNCMQTRRAPELKSAFGCFIRSWGGGAF